MSGAHLCYLLSPQETSGCLEDFLFILSIQNTCSSVWDSQHFLSLRRGTLHNC